MSNFLQYIKHHLIVFILVVYFFKQFFLINLIPVWHTPDEQAHFAQVAYFSEFGRMAYSKPLDLNKEILESEKLLGTERDSQGNNKFTYHPEYRIFYTDTDTGLYENKIKTLSRSYRTEIVKQEAANYPPLYYWLAAITYKIFNNQDLFTRVFSARLVSLLMGMGTIYFSWKIGGLIFPKSKFLQFSLTNIIIFHPMLSFVSAGVNSDNLMNMLMTGLLYFLGLLIKEGITLKRTVVILITLFLMYLTKPQFLLALPVIVCAYVLSVVVKPSLRLSQKIIILSIPLIFTAVMILVLVNTELYSYIEEFYPQSFHPGQSRIDLDFLTFVKNSLIRIVAETIPWYWGVFNWLGVTLPRDTNRILNRLMILSAVGMIFWLYRFMKNPWFESTYILMLFIAAGFYGGGIIYYNYLFTASHAYSFGIQGRYFFPTVISHMTFLLIGLIYLIPDRIGKIKNYLLIILGLFFIFIGIQGIVVITQSYYDLSSLSTFIHQAGQYKPWYFKSYWILVWGILAVTSIVSYVYIYLNLKQDETTPK